MNVLIVCAAGMSSSALTQKLRDAVREQGMDVKIGACGSSQVQRYALQADLVFIAPQISYLAHDLESSHVKCCVIPEQAYGMQDMDVMLDMIRNPDHYSAKQEKQSIGYRIAEMIGTSTTVQLIMDAFSLLMPISVVGSILTLLDAFPIPYVKTTLANGVFQEYLNIGITMTLGMVSLYLSALIAICFAEKKGMRKEGLVLACLLDFMAFSGISTEKYICIDHFDGRGMLCAIIISILSCHLYSFIHHRFHRSNSGYLMTNIAESFLSMVPVSLCLLCSLTISAIVYANTGMHIVEWADQTIADSLSGIVGNNGFSLLLLNTVSVLFWFCGVHGGKLTGTVKTPLFQPLSYANLAAWKAGKPLPYLFNNATVYMFYFGGVGSTLGLAFLMCFFGKSHKMRKLGKLSFPMGIFFINEPLIFGLPFVLNFDLFLPFLFIPLLSGVTTMTLTGFGILPPCIGFDIPWTTPPIISGFLQGGWKLALWQAVLLMVQTVMWYPVFRKLDTKEMKKENSHI